MQNEIKSWHLKLFQSLACPGCLRVDVFIWGQYKTTKLLCYKLVSLRKRYFADIPHIESVNLSLLCLV